MWASVGQEELLALRPGSRLLNTGSSRKLLASNNPFALPIARNDEGLTRRHHNHQMIHTIANPVKFSFNTIIERVNRTQRERIQIRYSGRLLRRLQGGNRERMGKNPDEIIPRQSVFPKGCHSVGLSGGIPYLPHP